MHLTYPHPPASKAVRAVARHRRTLNRKELKCNEGVQNVQQKGKQLPRLPKTLGTLPGEHKPKDGGKGAAGMPRRFTGRGTIMGRSNAAKPAQPDPPKIPDPGAISRLGVCPSIATVARTSLVESDFSII